MIIKLPKEKMGTSNLGWLESRFHFSFAEYRNPENINFGVLRVLNDDIIHPNSGFDTHPHSNVEIISYVVHGEITHKDSMGNSETLKKGEVQYLSAGDGIYHSEHNIHNSQDLRLLQIWIIPPTTSLPKLYGSYRFKEEEKENKLLNIVSSQKGNAKIKIYQDINIYASKLQKNKKLEYKINENRQVYFVQIEGSSKVNTIELRNGDALEITNENMLNIEALSNSHFLFIEMEEIN
ncbi:pirin family protein [Poseidonibacter ostreae]|uniref:pirin family protein n=1 Tax=Poseidonibacter ostreae TaxID=2654171 RepID=UPI0012644CBB|nr:pirin family protein [Poseidonibacter ostreae]KAB7887658.1 pirin family protein [Poseidonibacter ostreae]